MRIVSWHFLNHRLALAASDTIAAVDSTQSIEDFFGKIYRIYSQSAKLRRELRNIAYEKLLWAAFNLVRVTTEILHYAF